VSDIYSHKKNSSQNFVRETVISIVKPLLLHRSESYFIQMGTISGDDDSSFKTLHQKIALRESASQFEVISFELNPFDFI